MLQKDIKKALKNTIKNSDSKLVIKVANQLLEFENDVDELNDYVQAVMNSAMKTGDIGDTLLGIIQLAAEATIGEVHPYFSNNTDISDDELMDMFTLFKDMEGFSSDSELGSDYRSNLSFWLVVFSVMSEALEDNLWSDGESVSISPGAKQRIGKLTAGVKRRNSGDGYE